MRQDVWWARVVMLLVVVLQPACRSAPSNEAVLTCATVYAGTETTHVIRATQEPYQVAPINLFDRFEFKAVYVTEPADVAGINLYVYHPGDSGSVLLHQAKYRPPYPKASARGRFGFTGLQLVYDENARELQYWCNLAKQPAS